MSENEIDIEKLLFKIRAELLTGCPIPIEISDMGLQYKMGVNNRCVIQAYLYQLDNWLKDINQQLKPVSDELKRRRVLDNLCN